MEILCKRKFLSEIENLKFIDTYSEMIRPLEYEFDVIVNKIYTVLGIQIRRGTPWVYVISGSYEDPEVQIVPALLFDFMWCSIPKDWKVRISEKSQEIEILPESLTEIEYWFEKYLDEEDSVLRIVNDEIDRMRSCDPKSLKSNPPEDPYAWPFEEYR